MSRRAEYWWMFKQRIVTWLRNGSRCYQLVASLANINNPLSTRMRLGSIDTIISFPCWKKQLNSTWISLSIFEWLLLVRWFSSDHRVPMKLERAIVCEVFRVSNPDRLHNPVRWQLIIPRRSPEPYPPLQRTLHTTPSFTSIRIRLALSLRRVITLINKMELGVRDSSKLCLPRGC